MRDGWGGGRRREGGGEKGRRACVASLPYAQTKVLTFIFICFNLLLYFYNSSRNKVRSTYDIYVESSEDVCVHVGVWVHVHMHICMCLVVVVVVCGRWVEGVACTLMMTSFPPHLPPPSGSFYA